MLLLIDIGNTSITLGAYRDDRLAKVARADTCKENRDISEYSSLLEGFMADNELDRPEGAVICSVVPEENGLFGDAVKKSFGIDAFFIHNSVKTGLKFWINKAESLGADRIANAVAAWRLYEGNTIVVDFGTATTVCLVTAEGQYRGGAILPGVGLSALALSQKTSKLPEIKLKAPEKILGNDTEGNIQTGVIIGHAGAVERIIAEIQKELGEEVSLIATGGYADLIRPYVKVDHVNTFLTLEGMRIIYKLNL
jgi:type III pantothenate kinase